MDTSEYMPMFLAEAQEHLQELNLAVVALEADPSNQGTVDQIFRIAHSLKGMSATMGFAAIAELTHVMEDVFELLRQRAGGLSQEAVTTLLACLDALQGAVESIESTGSESLDPQPLIDQLRPLIRERTPEQAIARAGGAALPSEATLAAAREAGVRVMHVVVKLDEQVLMPAVRAHMVLAALGEHGETLGCIPSPDAIENFQGHVVEAWIASEYEEGVLAAAATRVSDVATVDVSELPSGAGADADARAGVTRLADPGAVADADAGAGSVSGSLADVDARGTAAASTGAGVVEGAASGPRPTDQSSFVETPGAGAVPAGAAQASAAPGSAASGARAHPVPAARGTAHDAGATLAGHLTARTVRVDAERLDTLMHLMGELVIHRTAVEAYTASINSPQLQQAVQNLTRSSQALQSMVMQVRMIPVDVVFMRFPRLVRDLSMQLGKDVELKLVGRETELDRTVVDSLGDPLVHLVRNALDHGFEPPDVRIARGKPRTGTLTIGARQAGSSVVIEVRDDGRGVDPAAIGRKAAQLGIIDAREATGLEMKAAIELLFAPGFTTAEKTSSISGRGVGMDAVRAKIRELGGEVLMESTLGAGTLAQIRLPLTLAIVAALQVDIAGAPFAVPIDRIERTLRLDEHNVRQIAGRRLLSVEDGVLPLLEGAATFGRESPGRAPAPRSEQDLVVIVRGQDKRVGLTVDRLIGQREVVTRPLPAVVSDGQPVSGGAVLADGKIALIVDCDALVTRPARAARQRA